MNLRPNSLLCNGVDFFEVAIEMTLFDWFAAKDKLSA